MTFYEDIPLILNILSIVLLGFLFDKTKKYYSNKKSKELFRWIITENLREVNLLRSHELYIYISNAQSKYNISNEYRISSDEEWKTIKEMLKIFQEEVTQIYFLDKFHIPKSRYVINGDVYFMYLLQAYLKEHQCEDKISGHKMHSETIEYKSYGSWGATLYDATYELSDFGVLYHKLYYISYVFCKNSNVLNPKGEFWNNEKAIEEILNSKQISISRL